MFLNQNFHALTQSFSFFSDRPSTFWPSPSRFLLFLVFVLFFFFFWVGPSVFWLSPSRFIEPDLHYFDLVLPIYWVSPSVFTTSPSHFLSQSLSIFKVQFFEWILPILTSDLPCFNDVSPEWIWVSPSLFFSLHLSCFCPFCVLIWSQCALLTKLKMEECAGSVYYTAMNEEELK